MTLTKFTTTTGLRSVQAESMREAARIFAERLARREFGRRGRVGAIRQDCHSQDGSHAEYEAFIGKPGTEPNTTTGHNIRLTVYIA